MRDVSAVEQAQEDLRRREEVLRLSREVGSWELDVATGRMQWSEQLSALLHRSDASELSLADALAVFQADDRDLFARALDDSLSNAGDHSGRFRVILPDGRTRLHRVNWRTHVDGQRSARIIGINQDVTDLIERADALRRSEVRHRQLFTEAIEGIFSTTLDGTIIDANPAFARLLRIHRIEDLQGRSIGEFNVSPEGGKQLCAQFAAPEPMRCPPIEWRRTDGTLVWIEMQGRLVRDDRGVPLHFQGFVRDVTAEHQRTRALHALGTTLARSTGEAFLEGVARTFADIVGADIAFVSTRVADSSTDMRTLALVADGVVHPPVRYSLEGAPCEQAMRGRTVFLGDKAADTFPSHPFLSAWQIQSYVAAPLMDANGAALGVIAVLWRRAQGHSEHVESLAQLFALRAAAELERRRADARFEGVFEFAPDALLIVGPDGVIAQVNRQAERMLGYSREELRGLPVEALIPEGERERHATHRARYAEKPATGRMGSDRTRMSARRKDGTLVPVEVSLSPMETEEGRIVVAAVRDVSERVREEDARARLEAQLQQARKMESLGTLAGGIAHDFNNLLAAIVVSTEVARGDGALRQSTIEHLDRIALASARARDLVRQILSFSRREPQKVSVTRPGEVVAEVARLLRAALPAGITLDVQAGVAADVLGDASQLHQVLMNLGSNAWQAIPDAHGAVTFRIDTVDVDAALAATTGLAAGPHTRIQVADTGVGMDDATRQRVFEPFFTTKEVGKGTGLGLAVVHGIVAAHRGAVTVESTVGQGTTFSVYLPPAPASAVAAPSDDAAVPVPGGRRLLYVDDEEPLLRGGTLLLERFGFDVTPCASGREAMEALRSEPSRFDVVITDHNMPGMSGVDLARAIAELRPDLPVVLTSGNLTHGPADAALANVRYRLRKPYTGKELAQAVATAWRA